MTYQRRWLPKKDPWAPADHDDRVVAAVRAFANGSASPDQQKTAWDWLHYVAGVGDEFADLTYRPGAAGDRDTAFASGKQWPILQMRKLLRPEFNPREIVGPQKSKAQTAKERRAQTLARIRDHGTPDNKG